MTYMENLETHLKQLLTGTPEGELDIIIREMKKIVLESYRNGQKAGAPKTVRPNRRAALAALAAKQ